MNKISLQELNLEDPNHDPECELPKELEKIPCPWCAMTLPFSVVTNFKVFYYCFQCRMYFAASNIDGHLLVVL